MRDWIERKYEEMGTREQQEHDARVERFLARVTGKEDPDAPSCEACGAELDGDLECPNRDADEDTELLHSQFPTYNERLEMEERALSPAEWREVEGDIRYHELKEEGLI